MHAFVLALALLALVCLPAVVAGMLYADEFLDRQLRRFTGRLAVRRERRIISRLDRSIGPVTRELDLTRLDSESRPAIEQIAADLRRLGSQRLSVATRSRVWHSAVLQAYDDRLRLASRCLGVAEHLGDLEGVDLEIERVRVEGELQAAGLILPTATADRREQR